MINIKKNNKNVGLILKPLSNGSCIFLKFYLVIFNVQEIFIKILFSIIFGNLSIFICAFLGNLQESILGGKQEISFIFTYVFSIFVHIWKIFKICFRSFFVHIWKLVKILFVHFWKFIKTFVVYYWEFNQYFLL